MYNGVKFEEVASFLQLYHFSRSVRQASLLRFAAGCLWNLIDKVNPTSKPLMFGKPFLYKIVYCALCDRRVFLHNKCPRVLSAVATEQSVFSVEC